MNFGYKDYRQYVVWGYRNFYHTHSHIHYGFYKALQYMFPNTDVLWIDERSDISKIDFSDTFFITNHDVAPQLPVRKDCFYLIHGGADYAYVRDKFWKLKRHMSWNVFIDANYTDYLPTNLAPADSKGRRPINRPEAIWVGEDAPYYPDWNHMDFRWATDLTPPEIQLMKAGAKPLNRESRVINYVGTYWRVNEVEINQFAQACRENQIQLIHVGAGQENEKYTWMGHKCVVSPEENVRLVRESYFAPAIVGSHHLTEGYVPCRIFKNVSYGQFGVTNSEKVNKLFEGKLICNPNPRELFVEAQWRLQTMPIEKLHELMDFVAERHTYVNRLQAIFKAVNILENS